MGQEELMYPMGAFLHLTILKARQHPMFFTTFPGTVQEPNAKLQAYSERYSCYSMAHQDSLSH